MKDIKKAICTYCYKEVFSMHQGQLDHNMAMHEANCPVRIAMEKKQHKESTDRETPARASRS